jgi:hypothetical protein
MYVRGHLVEAPPVRADQRIRAGDPNQC